MCGGAETDARLGGGVMRKYSKARIHGVETETGEDGVSPVQHKNSLGCERR